MPSIRSILLTCAATVVAVRAQGQLCSGNRNQDSNVLEIDVSDASGAEKCFLSVTREQLRSDTPSFPFDCSDSAWSGVLDNDPGAGGNNRYFTIKPGSAPEQEIFSSGFDGNFVFEFDC